MYESPISPQVPSQDKSRQMECFRFGLDFPSINRKADIISSKVLGLPGRLPSRRGGRRGGRGRGRGRGRKFTVPHPPPPVQLKMYKPPTFSIELANLFDVLDM